MTTGSPSRRAAALIAVTAVWLVCPSIAGAATDEEIFRELRFNFASPGARATSLGGAFVALADDTSAAIANPAGLSLLPGPQAFVELRAIDADTEIFESRLGSLEVDTSTGDRDLPFLGLRSVSAPDGVTEPAFVGASWPLRFFGEERGVTVAVARHLLLSEDRMLADGPDATELRFAFETFPNTVRNGQIEAYSVDTAQAGGIVSEIETYSLAASMNVNPDFSWGVALQFASLDVEAQTTTSVTDPLQLFLDPTHPRLPGQPDSDVFGTVIDDSDDDFGFSVGIHWHPTSVFSGRPSPVQLGAVFRKGMTFSVGETTVLNGIVDEQFITDVVVPDRFAIGGSYRIDSSWLVTAEIERIEFSDMLEGFRSGVSFLTSPRVTEGAVDIDPDGAVVFDVDDGTVPRVGVQYSRSSAGSSVKEWAVRAGAYRMPDGRLRMTQFNSTDPDVNAAFIEAFRGGDDVTHLTAGFGLEIGRSSISVAADLSDDGSELVGSYAFTFGRNAARAATPGSQP